jgi:hypothetical protein
MCEGGLNIQKMLQDVLFKRHLLQCSLLEQNGTAEEFQTKCVK